MASEVGIVNAALDLLGEPAIISFADNSKAGRLAAKEFANIRDALYSRHPWNFGRKRDALAALADAPAWGYDFQYQLPSDYIRMFNVEGENEGTGRWVVEDGKILTDLTATLNILYGYKVTAAAQMSAGFRDALAATIAKKWAETITGSNDVVQSTRQNALVAVAQARSNDGQEGIPDAVEADLWTGSRY